MEIIEEKKQKNLSQGEINFYFYLMGMLVCMLTDEEEKDFQPVIVQLRSLSFVQVYHPPAPTLVPVRQKESKSNSR